MSLEIISALDEIFHYSEIGINVVWKNVARTNVSKTVGACQKWPRKVFFKLLWSIKISMRLKKSGIGFGMISNCFTNYIGKD